MEVIGNWYLEGGMAVTAFRNVLRKAVGLFGLRGKEQETAIEQRFEEYGRAAYEDLIQVNFSEIFSTRLSNYTISGSSVSVENEKLNELVEMAFRQANKWCPMAFGVGRVYLVPRANAPYVMMDVIDQSRVIDTRIVGAETFGFVCVSDTRTIGSKVYNRVTYHDYDPQRKTYTVRQKATNQSGETIPLTVVPEWAEMQDYEFTGVERVPFGVLDSPKDNRTADNAQGAPIIYGCRQTIQEIWETIDQYKTEYENKQSILGVSGMLVNEDRDGTLKLPKNHILSEMTGRLGDSGQDLFSVYSPDIRSEAYRSRLLDLFGRLEKQVGTSSGILTPADTSMATATQVKRAMYDTWAMVSRMRANIEKAFDGLTYGMAVMQNVIGESVPTDSPLTWSWSREMLEDPAETFGKIMQAHSADAVSTAEVRQQIFPSETPEEAERKVQEIRDRKPEPLFDFAENFGKEEEPENG